MRLRSLAMERLEERVMLAVDFHVTTTVDEISNNGQMSLREAIIAANAVPSGEIAIINLQPGATYQLTRSRYQPGHDTEGHFLDPQFGDLDIRRSVLINGNGATITAGAIDDRVLDIRANSGAVALTNLTIEGGRGQVSGGGIFASGTMNLGLFGTEVRHNETAWSNGSEGAGLYANLGSSGQLFLMNSTFYNNRAHGQSFYASSSSIARGGGIFVTNTGLVDIRDSTFIMNGVVADNVNPNDDYQGGFVYGGALAAAGVGSVIIEGSTFTSNQVVGGNGGEGRAGGPAHGGAVYIVGSSGSINIEDSTFTSNSALAGSSYGVIGSSTFGDYDDFGIDAVSAYGGGVAIDLNSGATTVTATISNTVFENNRVRGGNGGDGERAGGAGGGGYGGGLAFYWFGSSLSGDASQLTVTGSLFNGNRVQGGLGGGAEEATGANHWGGTGGAGAGGGVYAKMGTQKFIDTSFISNEAIAGEGGFAFEGRGGRGGYAYGGAIESSSSKNIEITGSMALPGAGDDELTATALFQGNKALGGTGGFKPNSDYTDNDQAGHGGDAHGGAVVVRAGGNRRFDSSGVVYHGNAAMGGNGGDGYYRPNQSNYIGAKGGNGGTARGGAVYTLADTDVVDNVFTQNLAIGARFDLVEGSQNLDNTAGAAGGRGGPGGNNRDGNAYDGGAGGSAYGGALYLRDRNLYVFDSSFNGNQAVGAAGGAGGPGREISGRDGGRGGSGGGGGEALGGAIRAETTSDVTINRSTFVSNIAVGGRGGSGGQGGRAGRVSGDTVISGGVGGDGGTGGVAGGGAVSIVGLPQPNNYNANQLAGVLVEQTFFYGNAAMAGDGGFSGSGGAGAQFSGRGGRGGHGAEARGGGLHLAYANTEIATSTFAENLAAGGYGANGGYAGSSHEVAAGGGGGGDGGHAFGGAIYIDTAFTNVLGTHFPAGTLDVYLSTFHANQARAGNGGHGGFGGFAKYGAGGNSISNGGNGGRGGDARGGGIHVRHHPQFGMAGTLQSVTIARNYIEAGDGGFGSPGARINPTPGILFTIYDTPIRYEAAAGANLVSGSSQYILNGTVPGLGVSFDQNNSIQNPASFGGLEEINVGPVTANDIVTLGALLAGGTAAVAGAGILGGAVAGFGLGGMLFATPTALVAGSTVFGGVLAGGLLMAVGGVLLSTAIANGVMTGDWEGSFAAVLGTPGTTHAYNFGILLTGVREEEHDPGVIYVSSTGATGSDGTWGALEGTGVHGGLALSRTLVADNTAANRELTRTVPPGYESDPGVRYRVYAVSEQINPVGHIQDVDGLAIQASSSASDRNFISKVNSGFANAIKGTTDNPLDAKLDSGLTMNPEIASTPTLKLMPGSPARGAITGATSFPVSQNGYWYPGTTRDIGAWGGPPNSTPVAGTPLTYFGLEDDEPVLVRMDGLLAGATDVDGDPLTVVNNLWWPVPAPGSWAMVTIDDDVYFQFTPNPGFSGTSLFWFRVTDGQYESADIPAWVEIREYNRPPVGTDSINVHFAQPNVTQTVSSGWFGFTDPDNNPPHTLNSVLLGEITGRGQWLLQYSASNIVPLAPGDEITYEDLISGRVKFRPDENTFGNNYATLLFKVRDTGGTAGLGQNLDTEWRTLTIRVLNQAPTADLPSPPDRTIDEDASQQSLFLSNVTTGTPQEDEFQTLTITVTSSNPAIVPDPTVDLSDLSGFRRVWLRYTPVPDAHGLVTITVELSDGELTTVRTFNITVNPVNDAPVNTVPDPFVVSTAGPVAVPGFSVSDVDDPTGVSIITVMLDVLEGALELGFTEGVELLDGDGTDGTLALRGTLAAIDAVLDSLVYLPPVGFSGTDRIRIITNDHGNGGLGGPLTAENTVPISIEIGSNSPPTANPGMVTTNEDTPIEIDLRLLVSDIDTPIENLTFTVFDALHGQVELLADGHTVRFTPNANYNDDYGMHGAFSYTVTDPVSGATRNSSVTVHIQPVNDAPEITVPGPITITGGGPITITGILVSDVDNHSEPFGGPPVVVTLDVVYGVLELTSTDGLELIDGDGSDGTLTIKGTLSAINAALAGLVYTPAAGFNGVDRLRIVVDDQGNGGLGGPLTAEETVAIQVNVASAPAVTAFEVSGGLTQRSYIRYLSLTLNQPDLIETLIAEGPVRLTRYELDGSGPGVDVSLDGVLSVSGNQFLFDFGLNGIGGNRNTNAGDGYYVLSLDLDGDGSFETTRSFYRLFGDVNGDGIVDEADFALILSAFGTPTSPEYDVNGDGVVNAQDRVLAIRNNGKKLAPELHLDA